MYSPTDIGHRGHSLQELIAYILGVRRSEAHAQEWRYLGHTLKELWEVYLASAVRVDILAEERHLTVAILKERASLGDDSRGIAATLYASRIGYYAVRAVVVATAHNSYKGTHTILIEAHRGYLAMNATFSASPICLMTMSP